jgi:putative flippase GtrA
VPRRIGALRPFAELVVVTGYNALTLGGALLVFGRTAGLDTGATVVAAHATSAVLSYAFCRLVVWRRPRRALGRELSAAAGFFTLAGLSAIASLGATATAAAQARSLSFLLVNYAAVGAIALGKFVVQRALLTDGIPWPVALRPAARP